MSASSPPFHRSSDVATLSPLRRPQRLAPSYPPIARADDEIGDVATGCVPKMTLVSAPTNDGTISTRSAIPHRVHASIGVLAAITVATATRLAGSPAAFLAIPPADGRYLIDAAGIMEVFLDLDGEGNIKRTGTVRTARKLFDEVEGKATDDVGELFPNDDQSAEPDPPAELSAEWHAGMRGVWRLLRHHGQGALRLLEPQEQATGRWPRRLVLLQPEDHSPQEPGGSGSVLSSRRILRHGRI